MKLTAVLCVVLFLPLAACDDNSTNPGGGGANPSVPFTVGNAYRTRSSMTVPGLPPSESFQTDSITADTTLGGKIYYVFTSRKLLRSTPDAVYRWNDTGEVEYYRFSVSVNDTINALGFWAIVQSVDQDSIFGTNQLCVNISDQYFFNYATYSTKFGVVNTQQSMGFISTTTLVGARIGSRTYGSI